MGGDLKSSLLPLGPIPLSSDVIYKYSGIGEKLNIMKNSLAAILLSFLIIVNSAYGNKRTYTMEEVIKTEGIYYEKVNNKPINGVLKIYHDSGGQMVIPINNGLRHGVAKYFLKTGELIRHTRYENGKKNGLEKTYRSNGNVLVEFTFENNRLISQYQYSYDGVKEKIPDNIVYEYNLKNPNSLESKEAKAYVKIENAIKSVDSPKYDKNMTDHESMKNIIEVYDKAFDLAGYNFFETINIVVEDLKIKQERILLHGKSRHKLILLTFGMMRSDCEQKEIDCLQFFPADTRPSAKWLLGSSGFSW